MSKRWIVLTIWSMLVSLLIAFTPVMAQTSNTEAVVRGVIDAINTGDVEGALALVAEDAVITLFPPPPGTEGVFRGKEAIGGWWQGYVAGHGHTELTAFHTFGNTAVWSARVGDDAFTQLGVGELEFDGVGVVQGGLLKSYTWSMTEASQAHLEAALAKESNKALLRQAYDQVFSQGKLELLDEAIAPDAVDHSFPELTGVDAFKEPIAALRTAFPDLQASAELMVAEGDVVMALVTFTGTHEGEFLGIPPTGQQITWSHVDINRLENGKVVEAWHIGVPAAILQALGYQLTPPAE
jgi:predicted ester cyclase